jgi:hypothetical protein
MLLRAWAHRPIFPVGGAVARLDMTARSVVLDGWMDGLFLVVHVRARPRRTLASMVYGRRQEIRDARSGRNAAETIIYIRSSCLFHAYTGLSCTEL